MVYSWNQPLRIAVGLKRRNTGKVLIVHAYDGTEFIQIKGFGSAIEKFKETFKARILFVKFKI